MDAKVLAAEITASTEIQCAVTWKVIYTGQKNQPESEKIRAYHIQINAVGQQASFEKLSSTYGRSNNGFDSNRKMRFYPTWFRIHSENSREKFRKATLRQKNFCQLVQEDNCANIASLDSTIGDHPSLRSIICSLKSHAFPNLPLFISADQHFFENAGVVFQYMPHIAQEANMMMHNLIPYLRHTIGDDILPYFRSEAVKAAENFTWDEENHRVICPTDANMDQDEDDDPFELAAASTYVEEASKAQDPPPPTTSSRPTPQNPPPHQALTSHDEANAYYKDDDSLSTISHSVTQQQVRIPPPNVPPPQSVAASNVFIPRTVGTVGDSASVSSGITMESFQNVLQEQQRTARVLDAILARLPPIQNSQAAGTTQDQNAGGTSGATGEQL